MVKNLVIVESPAKAKTIEGYLGKHYKVVSCNGHVRNLPKHNKAIDIENGFRPTYEVSKDKKAVLETIKAFTKAVDYVYLASDDDREGEAISWHLKEALNLNDKKTRRIVFREITKNAILNALKNPRDIDFVTLINHVDYAKNRELIDNKFRLRKGKELYKAGEMYDFMPFYPLFQ